MKKYSFLIKNIVPLFLTILTILSFLFFDDIFSENSIFKSPNTGSNILDSILRMIPLIINTIQLITLGIITSFILKKLLQKVMNKNSHRLTIFKLFASFVNWIIIIVFGLLILSVWGVDTTTLVASAGVLTLVIGLGAQSLVADIVAGTFIVLEGSMQVGDIVVVDAFRGTIQEVGIRTTRIKDYKGNIKIINNSQIHEIINYTKEISLAECIITISYEESIEKIEAIIINNLDKIKKNIPLIIGDIEYKGLKEFSSSGMNLLFFAKCKEEDVHQIQRELNKEFKLLLDRYDISMPYSQLTISYKDNKL